MDLKIGSEFDASSSAHTTISRFALLSIAMIFLVSRATLLVVADLSFTNLLQDSGGHAGWLSYLCRWDCGWYLSIAQNGYSSVEDPTQPGATNYAFYPLFPLLVRVIAPVFPGNYLLAAIVVSNICFLAALVYIYRYSRLLGYDQTSGLLAVALLCILPQSIVFSAVYSESTFLLLLVAAVYYTRTERYLAAGIFAGLLSASRANGIFFILFALVWAIRKDTLRGFLRPWQRPELYIPIVFAPMGLFFFLGYCFLTTGDAFAHSTSELYGWGWSFGPPWENLKVLLSAPGIGPLSVVIGMLVLACSTLLLQARRYEEFILCLALILLVWSGHAQASLFRYWLVLFPVWVAVAGSLSSRPIVSMMTFSVLAVLNGTMTCAWILQKLIAI